MSHALASRAMLLLDARDSREKRCRLSVALAACPSLLNAAL
jgi:hypothetical protein